MTLSLPVNFDLKRVFKIGGVVLVALILIMLAVTLVSSTVKTVVRNGNISLMQSGEADSYGYGGIAMEGSDLAYGSKESVAMGAPTLSARNSALIPPVNGGGTTGSDAEDYEITEYRGTIETRNKDEACNALFDLKTKDYVIFEQANTHDKGCNITFKVMRDRVDEVVATVKSLDPKEFIESSHTIKRQVEDFTSEIQILEKKQAVIEDTLQKATEAYDEITKLATQTRDAESLASVINSKISVIERLTQERLNVSTQLDRLARAKAEQLDKLDYTYFYLNVFENKYLDGQNIKDSWKAAMREFVHDINKIAQDMSVNLITLILQVLQYLLYLLLTLIIAKYAWHLAKRIWKGPPQQQV